jgi:hypothetical protein
MGWGHVCQARRPVARRHSEVASDTEGISSDDVVGDGIHRVDLQRERARVDSDVVHSAPDAPVSEWGVRVRTEEEVVDVMVLVVGWWLWKWWRSWL